MSDIADAPAKYKSQVWKHFGFPKRQKGENVETDFTMTICRICKHEIKYTCKNTSNMSLHLKRKHGMSAPDTFRDDSTQSAAGSSISSQRPVVVKKESTQPTIADVVQNRAKLSAGSARSKLITKAITTLLAVDMRPFTLVDSKAFEHLIELLEPRYTVPPRQAFSSREIPALYSEVCSQVKKNLKRAQTIAMTTDGWTSRATVSYITVTAHTINDKWEMENYVLQTRPLYESHTGSNIAEVLTDAIQEWELKRKHSLQPVTSDGAANMGVAVREANLNPHIKCFAHTINLAAQQALKIPDVQRILGKIKKIVNFFHKSTTAARQLKLKQEMLQLPDHKLVNEVKTRWNSAYEMVERYLEQQAAVMAVLMSQEVRKEELDTLTALDVTAAELIVNVLKPLKTVTTVLCDQAHPTISMIMPLLNGLKTGLTAEDGDIRVVGQIKSAVLKDLEKRYREPKTREILLLATAIDPRFKNLPFLETDEKMQVFVELCHMTNTVYDSVKGQMHVKMEPDDNRGQNENVQLPALPTAPATLQDPVPLQTHSQEDVQEPPDKKRNLSALDTLLEDVFVTKEEPASVSQQDIIEEEVRKYRQTKSIGHNNSVLEWWGDNQFNFPYLCHTARHLLCIPATSVPSERVFSTAGDVVTAQRAALSPENVDMLIFLKKNIKL